MTGTGLALLYAPNNIRAYAAIRELYLNGCRRLHALPRRMCTPRLRVLQISDSGHHADGSHYGLPMRLEPDALSVLTQRTAHPVLLGEDDEHIQSAGPLMAQIERLTICGSGRSLPVARLGNVLKLCSPSLTYLSVGRELNASPLALTSGSVFSPPLLPTRFPPLPQVRSR